MPKRIEKRDFTYIAEYIKDEYDTRKGNRSDLDRVFKEIDRQVAMIPRTDHKMQIGSNGQPTGRRDPRKAWLPEIELPLQAEALETLVADTHSLLFPDSGSWFRAAVGITDEYLREVDFKSLILGDENEVPSTIDQDNANKLVQGYIDHIHRQYDFRGNVDVIGAEAISYGVGVGRGRMITKQVILDTARGTISQNQKIPVLVPRSIKRTYLDDRHHILAHQGYMIGPMTIFKSSVDIQDLQKQAQSGSTDPNVEGGGWVKANIRSLEPEKDNTVLLLEAEGDFAIPRKSGDDIFLPGMIFVVAIGANDATVIRAQFRQFPFGSVIAFPYHREKVDSVYCTSPLRKGWPLQAAATEALMRVVEVSALTARPPVSYDRSDPYFSQTGGPNIEPGALWGTIGDVQEHVFGDVAALDAAYVQFLQQYADAVGVNRARLGAQTLSHTTAFAKNAELQRGAVRTVDFAKTTLSGPLTQWLYMCYEMARAQFKGGAFYIESYGGFINLQSKKQLPDPKLVIFDAHGSGTPSDEQERMNRRLQALDRAIQIDNLNIQRGGQPKLDLARVILETMREGGWQDAQQFIQAVRPQAQAPTQPLQQLQAQALQSAA